MAVVLLAVQAQKLQGACWPVVHVVAMAQVFVLVMKKALALIVVNLGVDIVVVAEL